MKRKLTPALLMFIVGCAGPLVQPTQTDVERAQTKWQDVNLASLQLGHTVYTERCGGCHRLYRPTAFSEKKWLHEIPEMSIKAALSDREQQLVREYLLTMREAPQSK